MTSPFLWVPSAARPTPSGTSPCSGTTYGRLGTFSLGIRTAVAWILDNCEYTSLNFLLANEKHLYALRYPDFEDLYVRKLDAGEDLRGTSSYGTHAETSDHQGTILFASEKLDTAPSWEELEPGTLAVAHHDLLQLELHHL